MDVEACRRVAAEWLLLGEYYQAPLPELVVGMYVQDLSDLPEAAVIQAMRRLRMDPKQRRCPLPADVRARAQGPADDSAQELAARICGAIGSCGYTQPDAARRRIGPVGWQAVEQMGGWIQLCTLKTSELGTFRAQCRELCAVLLARAQNNGPVPPGILLPGGCQKPALPA